MADPEIPPGEASRVRRHDIRIVANMATAIRSVPAGIWALALLAVAVRLGFMLAFVNLSEENYHEFGAIAHNMHEGRGYALLHYDNGRLSPWASENAEPFPSALMPPGYVLVLYPFIGLDNAELRNILLLLIQHLAGAIAVVLVFVYAARHYSRTAAWASAALMCLLPDMVAASNTWGGTVFVHGLLLAVFLHWDQAKSAVSRYAPYLGGLLLGLLTLFRFEALLFAFLLLVWAWRKQGYANALKMSVVVLLVLSPWLIRNVMVFHEPVFSTSTGLNLYRGNNPHEIGAWSDAELNQTLREATGPDFELYMNRVYLNEAWGFIASHPIEALKRSAVKVLRLWTVDPSDDRSTHPIHVAFWFLLLTCAAVGLRGKRPPNVLLLYLLFSTGVTAVFFALLRHQVLMEVALIPLAGHGLAQFCTFTGLCNRLSTTK